MGFSKDFVWGAASLQRRDVCPQSVHPCVRMIGKLRGKPVCGFLKEEGDYECL